MAHAWNGGRIAADGSEVEALDERAVADASDELVSDGVQSVTIGLLNPYVNPTHERRAREIAKDRHPELPVSISFYGGIPARRFADELDGHSWWPLFKAVPTEYLEKYYPLRVHRYEARTDSGGAGYHRGGHEATETHEFLADGFISYQDDRAQTFPWGLQGGHHGARDQVQDGVDRSDGFDFGPVPGTEQLTRRIADERRELDAWMAAETRA